MNGPAEPQLVALRFGPFELDVRSGELRRNGTVAARLQPQPLKVLLLLADRPSEVVTREELQAEVWPAGTFVDFEQSLNFCVRQIRSALGDNANAPRYVETLPRRGYRWVGGAVEGVGTGATVREWPRAVPTEGPEAAPATPDAGSSSRPWLTVLALLLALAALAGWKWLPPAPTSAPPSFDRITFRRGAVGSARFAPGGQVVYSAAWESEPRALRVAGPSWGDARDLGLEGASVAAVSTSGEVAFLRQGVLGRIPLSGGPPKEVLKGVVAADWAPDGTDFAVARRAPEGFRVEFPVGRVLASFARVSRLRLSPGGRHVAVAEHPIPDDDRGLVVILDREGRRVAASPEWASLEGIAWTPGGRELLFTASAVGADNAVHALSLDGRVRRVLSGLGRLVVHDVSPEGRVLLERVTLRGQILYRRASEAEDRDLSWLDFSGVKGIAPAGDVVLFFESGQGGGPGYTTFLRRADGAPPVRVGTGRALDLSPDGAWVLSVSLGKPDHLDLTPTGPGETREIRLPGLAAHEEAGFVGTDRLFVTGRDARGRRGTWLARLDGTAAEPLPLPEGGFLLQNTFTPDGSRFAFSCPELGGVCLFETKAGRRVPVPGAGEGWRPVGFDRMGRLYLRDRTRHMPETLVRLDVATGRATPLAELGPRDRAGATGILGVVVAADGEAWAYSVVRRLSDLHVVSGLQ